MLKYRRLFATFCSQTVTWIVIFTPVIRMIIQAFSDKVGTVKNHTSNRSPVYTRIIILSEIYNPLCLQVYWVQI